MVHELDFGLKYQNTVTTLKRKDRIDSMLTNISWVPFLSKYLRSKRERIGELYNNNIEWLAETLATSDLSPCSKMGFCYKMEQSDLGKRIFSDIRMKVPFL